MSNSEIIEKLRLLRLNLERTKREVSESLNAIECQIDALLPSMEPVDREGWKGEIANW